jgi:hypothetical protein
MGSLVKDHEGVSTNPLALIHYFFHIRRIVELEQEEGLSKHTHVFAMPTINLPNLAKSISNNCFKGHPSHKIPKNRIFPKFMIQTSLLKHRELEVRREIITS